MKKQLLLVLIILIIFPILTACKDTEPEIDEEEIEVALSLLDNDQLLEGFEEFRDIVLDIDYSKTQERIIDEFFELTKDHTFPLQEGNDVIFIYRATDETDKVELTFDLNLWEREEMDRLADTSLYYKVVNLPAELNLDYFFWVDDEVRLDKLNNNVVAGSYFAEVNNLQTPDYETLDYWQDNDEVSGKLIEKESFKIYLPPDYDSEVDHSVTYFVGPGYLENGNLKNTLDRLRSQGDLENNIAVFVNEITLENENLSLALAEIDDYLLDNYSVLSEAENKYLIAYDDYAAELINVAFNHQDKYLNLLLQSPQLTELPEFPQTDQGLDIYIDWGQYLYSSNSTLNLDFARELKDNDYSYGVQIYNSGNQWSNWRENIFYGLNYFFAEEKITPENNLIIKDDFTKEYSHYFKAGETDDFRASRDNGVYRLEFEKSKSIEFDNYEFRDFNLEVKFVDIEGGFGFTILGKKDYTILKNTVEKEIYLSSLEGDTFEEISFSDDFKLERMEIISEDDKLKVAINGIVMDKLTMEKNGSMKLGLLGTQDTVVEMEQIKIIETLN